jgi:hypothetical protein
MFKRIKIITELELKKDELHGIKGSFFFKTGKKKFSIFVSFKGNTLFMSLDYVYLGYRQYNISKIEMDIKKEDLNAAIEDVKKSFFKIAKAWS